MQFTVKQKINEASMGPRQCAGENSQRYRLRMAIVNGFNGAPAVCRGEPRSFHTYYSGMGGFNGAPAVCRGEQCLS